MVIFVDLDDPDEVEHQHHGIRSFDTGDSMNVHAHTHTLSSHEMPENQEQQEEQEQEQEEGNDDDDDQDREHPNLNALSAVLGTYPIISEIAKHLDLNSLDDLSRTCRQFRANLLQHRRQLIPQTLRCSFDAEGGEGEGGLGYTFQESHDEVAWTTRGPNGVRISRMTSGRVGACARDMVGECRRCGVVVCRNCTMKAPSTTALKSRHRRLCRTCTKAPLDPHTRIYPHHHPEDPETPPKPLYRSPCTCSSQIWICNQCSTTLRAQDTSYMRAWTWRSRYSTHLDGLGTGIGQGVEGVQCGRSSRCLSSRTIFTEIECDSAAAADSAAASSTTTPRNNNNSNNNNNNRTGAGYFLQEIEGIGGVVKKKVKRKMEVGAVVGEYEDERESGGGGGGGAKHLGREQEGSVRSWCFWCQRVVLGKKDVLRFAKIDGGGGGGGDVDVDVDLLGTSLTAESDDDSNSSSIV